MRSPALQAGSGLVPRTPPRGCGFEGGSCGSYSRPRPPLGFLSPGRGEFCRPPSHAARNTQAELGSRVLHPRSQILQCLGIGARYHPAAGRLGACWLHPKYAETAFCPVACSPTERRTREG